MCRVDLGVRRACASSSLIHYLTDQRDVHANGAPSDVIVKPHQSHQTSLQQKYWSLR